MPEWNAVITCGPGPALCGQGSTLGGPGYRIGVRYRSRTPDQTPGPAAYSPEPYAIRPRPRSCHILRRYRTREAETVGSPGPATYSTASGLDLTMKRAASAIIPRSTRSTSLEGSRSTSPGPAAYTPYRGWSWCQRHVPGGTIGVRYYPHARPGTASPGPADYTPRPPRSTRKGFTVSGYDRFGSTHSSSRRDSTPGPATYRPQQIRSGHSATAHGVSIARRYTLRPIDRTPGPADYAERPAAKGPAFSLRGRHYIYRFLDDAW